MSDLALTFTPFVPLPSSLVVRCMNSRRHECGQPECAGQCIPLAKWVRYSGDENSTKPRPHYVCSECRRNMHPCDGQHPPPDCGDRECWQLPTCNRCGWVKQEDEAETYCAPDLPHDYSGLIADDCIHVSHTEQAGGSAITAGKTSRPKSSGVRHMSHKRGRANP